MNEPFTINFGGTENEKQVMSTVTLFRLGKQLKVPALIFVSFPKHF